LELVSIYHKFIPYLNILDISLNPLTTRSRPEFSNYIEDNKNYKVELEGMDKINAIIVPDPYLVLLNKDVYKIIIHINVLDFGIGATL
jgi:hypothetical protein